MPISPAIPEQTTGDSCGVVNSDAKYSKIAHHMNGRSLTAVTPRQAQIIAAIHTLRARIGRWPSALAIAREIERNITIVRRRILVLQRIGVVRWTERGVGIVRQPDGVFLTLAQAFGATAVPT